MFIFKYTRPYLLACQYPLDSECLACSEERTGIYKLLGLGSKLLNYCVPSFKNRCQLKYLRKCIISKMHFNFKCFL